MKEINIIRSEVALFKYIWQLSDKRSYLSGLYLRDLEGTEFWFAMFAHILPKARNKYPHFKLFMGNIKLLTPGEHHLLDNGTEKQRIKYSKEVPTADWDKIYSLKEQLITFYKEKFPYTKHWIIGYRYSEEEVKEEIRRMNSAWLVEYNMLKQALMNPQK